MESFPPNHEVREVFMSLRWIAGWIAALCLTGCASGPSTALKLQSPWLDHAFAYEPGLVSVKEAELFALDADLLAELRSSKLQKAPSEDRINYIVKTLIDNKALPFLYVVGHSTVASETWRNRSGDCLSLTVLAYAMAKELNLAVTIQEAAGSDLFDRRGSTDYRVGHVNVYVSRQVVNEAAVVTTMNRGVVIDFEPAYGTGRSGYALTAKGVLARYYNNLGAEYLAKADVVQAYAYFKAAIQADPEFSAAATNLATLYWNQGHLAASEALLTPWVNSDSPPEPSVRALHTLLMNQGRVFEAAHYQRLMDKIREHEPYYWIDQGLDYFQARNYRRAIESLEKAQKLATGFSEVHRYLAMAYLQDGKPDKAQEQLTTLAMIDDEDPAVGVIHRKILAARKAGMMKASL